MAVFDGDPAPIQSGPTDPTGGPSGRGTHRVARWAATAPFAIVGLVFASYFVRVPTLKDDFDLSAGQLGLILVLPTLAAVVTMQLTGGLVARFGSAPIVRISAVALPLSLLGIVVADNPVHLAAAMLVFGAVDGLIDVSMNAHAIAVERVLDRPVMNGCHAAWSIGAMAGSVLGGAAIKAGLTLAQHYLLLAVALVIAAVVAGRLLLPAAVDRVTSRPADGRKRIDWRTGWTPRVLMFGLAGSVVLLVEGAVGNWSGVLLREDLGTSLATASLGYIVFSICQAGGRLVGDRLQQRLGATLLVRCSGAVAVAGLTLVVLSSQPALVIAGFAVHGLGLSVLLPVIFSAVGHGGAESDTASAAASLSKFTTLTYSGLLLGPVLVGWSAQAIGLTTTMGVLIVLLAAVLVATSGSVHTADKRSEPRT